MNIDEMERAQAEEHRTIARLVESARSAEERDELKKQIRSRLLRGGTAAAEASDPLAMLEAALDRGDGAEVSRLYKEIFW